MKALTLLLAVACSGESVVTTEDALDCRPSVVLANPGPEVGCFRAVAGEGSSVRLVGDVGPGAPSVDVHVGEAYEALACSAEWGAPVLEACGGAS